jgi:3-deoxy-D-manno-octulosonic-acid transferase
MYFLYEIGIRLYGGILYLASWFVPKARKWVNGRRHWRRVLQSTDDRPVFWIHAASLGEFEQGRPVIEAFRVRHPDWRIVLTFFSPSGYEIRKDYPLADLVCYLPLDSSRNARDFVELTRPQLAVFIKYEFWANYLLELKKRNIPTLLISARFREEQPFFKWYGAFWRQMLGCFTRFFVQDSGSVRLLKSIGYQNVEIAGDTRVDRVLNLRDNAPENPMVEGFVAGRPTLVVGSSWEADESVYLPVILLPEFTNLQVIIAPHDPSESVVQRLIQKLPGNIVRYSMADADSVGEARFLIIDNVGMLNTLYRYGWVAWIGGGFGKGIHNTLEPAAYGLPVIFGPRYEKFEEARHLIDAAGAFSVKSPEAFREVLRNLVKSDNRQAASKAATGWLEQNKGATIKILHWIDQNQPQHT